GRTRRPRAPTSPRRACRRSSGTRAGARRQARAEFRRAGVARQAHPMPDVLIDGTKIVYEIVGESGPPWVITPGGRFGLDTPGIRELATELAARGQRVVIWDRPNCGGSDVCFEGASESEMQ